MRFLRIMLTGMFIKETKTRNGKTGAEYVKHTLVESVRTDKGPRQRTVMQLGRLSIPRKSWPLLADELERRISGQMELSLRKTSEAVSRAADNAMKNFAPRAERRKENVQKEEQPEYERIDMSSAVTSSSRSAGAELLVHDAWKLLELPKILRDLGFNKSERSLAEAVVAARMIEPGSDLHTWQWLRNNSAIGELTEEPLSEVGRNRVYAIADRLCGVREQIEEKIRHGFQSMFPDKKRLFLFDLTNFYLEGQALNNTLARRGKSKQKRSDCRLVSLALAVDSRGFPLFSRVYPGNVGEPSSLEDILTDAGLTGGEPCLPGLGMPTVVMDRGIATDDNIKLLRNNNINYIVIERGARNQEYLEAFKNAENDPSFMRIDRGSQPPVFVKKVPGAREGSVDVLCVSAGKKEKEKAIARHWEEHACEDLVKLQTSVRKGNIKDRTKILRKLGRLEERYSGFAKRFDIELMPEKKDDSRVSELHFKRKAVVAASEDEDDPLQGSYVIETQHRDMAADEIWKLYMTLTQVESAFRSFKTDLGTRPVHHQLAERTTAHLFISTLAYSLLAGIEYRLSQAGDCRSWKTVRRIMSTHRRNTVILTDDKRNIHYIRQTGMPEPAHLDIYRKLGVNYRMPRFKETIAKKAR